jgi:hypothetical protein
MIIPFLSGMLCLFGVEMVALAWIRSVDPATKGYVDKPLIAIGIASLILSVIAIAWAMG